MIRLRYLTRLLLFYYAQSRINALHNVFNRRQLDLLLTNRSHSVDLDEAEKFQKSFDLFEKITKGSYQLGALAVGGPLVALYSAALQKAVLPAATFIWSYLGGPTLATDHELLTSLTGFVVLFGICAIWTLVSAWMDMRSVLISVGVRKAEQDACVAAQIVRWREFPYDIVFYLGLIVLCAWGLITNSLPRFEHVLAMHPEADLYVQIQLIEGWATILFLFSLGVVALIRRLRS